MTDDPRFKTELEGYDPFCGPKVREARLAIYEAIFIRGDLSDDDLKNNTGYIKGKLAHFAYKESDAIRWLNSPESLTVACFILIYEAADGTDIPIVAGWRDKPPTMGKPN